MPELDTVQRLLCDAGASLHSVEITYRVWRHAGREAEARRIDVARARARGGSITSYGPARTEDLGEVDETWRIWRDAGRLRIEFEDGSRDGLYGVAADGLWWTHDPRTGARSDRIDPTRRSPPERLCGHMLDPAPLIPLLNFEVTGRDDVAGRSTVTVRATALPPSDLSGVVMGLYGLGPAADHYEFDIDAEHGVLLGTRAFRDGQPLQIRTATAVRFDGPIPEERFTFEPPAGEVISAPRRPRPA